MRSVIEVEMAAAPELVFRLVRDVLRWPELLPHYVSVRPATATSPDGTLTARMVARRPISDLLGLGLPVTWQARVWSEPNLLRLHFRHVAGATRGMDVTWRIELSDRGSRVSIEHDFRPRVAVFAVLVDRWFTRPIARQTLATFRSLAEALAAESAGSAGPRQVAAKSDRTSPTNPPA